jgi:hypothetical protein
MELAADYILRVIGLSDVAAARKSMLMRSSTMEFRQTFPALKHDSLRENLPISTSDVDIRILGIDWTWD